MNIKEKFKGIIEDASSVESAMVKSNKAVAYSRIAFDGDNHAWFDNKEATNNTSLLQLHHMQTTVAGKTRTAIVELSTTILSNLK